MAKKTASNKKTENTVVEQPAATPVVKKATRAKKQPVEPVQTQAVDVVVPPSVPGVRRVTTRDTVLEDFDRLSKMIEAELARVRGAGERGVPSKFLRTVAKHVGQLKTHSQKVMRKRRVTNADKSHNSIFQLPVQISEELANFNGWSSSEPRSRVEVTRALCKYIKDNNLQDPKDRRIILADAKLAKLLNYTPDKDTAPLNYSRLQSYMKVHFLNAPAPAPVVAPSRVAPSSSPSKSKPAVATKAGGKK